jgi:hypothetical protein
LNCADTLVTVGEALNFWSAAGKGEQMTPKTTEPVSPVPDQLMDDLHKANQRFHAARVELEHQMDGSEQSHQERVSAASEGVQAAEREVEAVTEQIGKSLHGKEVQIPKTDPDQKSPPRDSSAP